MITTMRDITHIRIRNGRSRCSLQAAMSQHLHTPLPRSSQNCFNKQRTKIHTSTKVQLLTKDKIRLLLVLLLLVLLLSIVCFNLLHSPALINTLLRDGLPHAGGVSVLVVVVVLADLVEEEHETSVRSDLGEIGQSSSPQSQNTVLLHSLASTVPQTVELDVHIRRGGQLVLGLHLLSDRVERERDRLGDRTSQTTVDEVLQTVQLRARLAPHVRQDLVRHELKTSEGNHAQNRSGHALVESQTVSMRYPKHLALCNIEK